MNDQEANQPKGGDEPCAQTTSNISTDKSNSPQLPNPSGQSSAGEVRSVSPSASHVPSDSEGNCYDLRNDDGLPPGKLVPIPPTTPPQPDVKPTPLTPITDAAKKLTLGSGGVPVRYVNESVAIMIERQLTARDSQLSDHAQLLAIQALKSREAHAAYVNELRSILKLPEGTGLCDALREMVKTSAEIARLKAALIAARTNETVWWAHVQDYRITQPRIEAERDEAKLALAASHAVFDQITQSMTAERDRATAEVERLRRKLIMNQLDDET